uniref:Prolyl endopeptidase n=1 Tax=Chenopodium quinoa TaxID=63459 RepID=A0A803L7N2_CHEQI
MSLSLLFKPKFIPISLRFLPAISITFFSTLCPRKPHFSYPSIDPPFPKKLPFKVTVHGRSWDDPYHWMSNINDPDFVNFLSQENSYAEAFMADTRVLQRKLFSEMGSRIPAKISTPPERWGPLFVVFSITLFDFLVFEDALLVNLYLVIVLIIWLYYQHIPEGKEYPILCRRLDTEESTGLGSLFSSIKRGFKREEILLDWNEIAEKYGYVHMGACRVSPDHNFLAYTLDKNGSEQFALQVKDLRYGHIISSAKADAVVSLAWLKTDLLCSIPSLMITRDHTELGSNEEKIVFTERDSRFCVDVTCTKDGKFVTINSNSRSSSEVYVIDAANSFDSLHRVHKRVHGVQYFLEHHRGFFYVLTNHPSAEFEKLHCGNFYLGICRVEDINSADWQNIILPKKGTSLQDLDVFDENLVLYYDKEGSSMICSVNLPIDVNSKRIVEIEDLNPWTFPVPSELCTMAPGSNHDYMASVYRVLLSSPVMPDFVVEYDLCRRSFNVVHQEEVSCATESAQANSSKFGIDGEPLSNIRIDKCKRQEGQSPGILEAYGAYGEVLDKSWSSDRLSLLDRGWVVAFADVRGGGGPDPSWHQYGSGVNKINSIYDLVSCGKYLVNEGYATKGRLAAIGTSAGSLLVGAAINFHPDLFCAVILKVPFLDVCNTLMDDSLPLTILDYDEFGNPKIESQFERIMEYSPYDNINKGLCYPSMLVTAAFNDSRVGVWEAAKWVAKVREETCTSCSRAVILKTEMYGGHFSEGGRFGQSEEKAYEYVFLMKVMGLLDSSKH